MTGLALTVRAAMGRHDFAAARDCVDRTLQDRGWRDKDIVTRSVGRVVPGERFAVVDAHRRRPHQALSASQTSAAWSVERWHTWSWSFPGTPDEARVRSGRNISDVERWLSMAAGAGLALYGLSRRKRGRLDAHGRSAACCCERGASGHCHIYEALGINTAGTGEDTRRALGGSRASTSTRASRSTARSRSSTASGATSRTCRSSCTTSSRSSASPTRFSHWRAHGPGGTIVEWDAEIINEVPNKVIGWRSLEGSDVVSAGSVNFDDAGPGRGTRVRVHLQYSPPGGKVGAAVARLFGRDAATEIREDLRRFKQLIEAGEVPTDRTASLRHG